MVILPFSLKANLGPESRKAWMRALAAAFPAPPRRRVSSSDAIQRETLIPALAASIRTQPSVASSMLMVTFFMTRISCFTNFVSMIAAGHFGDGLARGSAFSAGASRITSAWYFSSSPMARKTRASAQALAMALTQSWSALGMSEST